jgi:hypothetical protein
MLILKTTKMKKLLIAICMMAGIAGIATAQQAPKKAPVKKEVKTVVVEKTKTVETATAGPKKADGTLDKRFKANKGAAAPAAGPLKKDGTPDKRFKANKKD